MAEKVRIATVILALLFVALILPRINAHDLPTNDPSDYIRPYDPEVVELAKRLGSIEAAYNWVAWNIKYMNDRDRWGELDYWQLPSTTIRLRTGDCEDQAILLTSFIRALEVPRENVHLVYGRIEWLWGGLVGYHAWVEVKIPEKDAQALRMAAMQTLESLLQENKTIVMVIYLEDRPLYLNITRETIIELQTLGWGDRDGWIPLDTTGAFLILPDGTKIPIPFSLWMWFGYYVYYLACVKAVPENFYVDKQFVYVTNATIPVGGKGTVKIVLDSAATGVFGYNITFSIPEVCVCPLNGSCECWSNARIAGVKFPDWTKLNSTRWLTENYKVELKAVDINDAVKPGYRDVVLAEIEIEGVKDGSAMACAYGRIDDDFGNPAFFKECGNINVTGCPKPVAGAIPRDINSDGLYEDINGNGRLDFDDVVKFFNYLEDPSIQECWKLYDFNGNGRLDFDDVVKLFKLM